MRRSTKPARASSRRAEARGSSRPQHAPAMLTSYGGHKVQEECGELQQALGKLGAFPDGEHPDGGPPLVQRIEDESGDVLAAVTYYLERNGLDLARVEARARVKLAQFRRWGLTGLDGRVAPPEPGNCPATRGDLSRSAARADD